MLRDAIIFKGKKFKLFNSLFYSVYQSLFSIADLFAVVICDPVRDRHSRRLTCLFMHVLRALATLNQTSELDYSIWEGANNNNFLLFTNPLYKTLLTYTK